MSFYFEEFEIGRRYPTYSRTITEADLVLFCSLVGYHNPIFIDQHYAKNTRFGGRIVPSGLTMAYSTAMTESYFRTTIIAHLSSHDATFHAPVRPGDTISTEVEVIAKESRSERSGLITFRDHVTNQDGVRVYSVDKRVLIAKRPAS
ncbi:MAG TPA: MaoC family dehydratase [Burkholderiaceae bacterium]|jgi:3-hydroxybutyryl-CoA dehydratase|nr:MaoC family dehydratase [Burkholderiaceae bacterium]